MNKHCNGGLALLAVLFLATTLLTVRYGSANDRWQTLHSIGEQPVQAQLESYDALTSTLTFRLQGPADKPITRKLELGELVYWGGYDDVAQTRQVVLSDASVLNADIESFNNATLIITSRIWSASKLNRELIRGMNLVPSREITVRQHQLASLRKINGRDHLFLANGDQFTGAILSIDSLEESDLRLIRATSDAGEFDFPFSAVSRISLADSDQAESTPDGKLLVGLTDGSLISVDAMDFQEDAITFQLACGATLSFTNGREKPLAGISFMQSTSSRIVYLSSLKPLQSKTIPVLSASYNMQMNNSVTGSPLRYRDHTYPRGIGMHATTSSAFKIDGEWNRFAADLAIDQSAGDRGSVVFRVFLLGSNKDSANDWTPAYQSEIVRGNQAAVSISVELKGATAIALAVEHSDRGDILDRANWLNARFEK